jgi:hypothetical protein
VSATAVAVGPTFQPFQPGTRRTVGIRVSRGTGPLAATAHSDPYRAADAEDWTGLFEVSEGRFPVNVAHLQGRDAYGCDWLSFASVEDVEAFRADPSRTDLVVRFIETKSGTIELTDNETRAAELRHARYFIYRVEFFSSWRNYADLTIVANPLSHRNALLARYEFRIDAVEGRERYQLIADSPEAGAEGTANSSGTGA